MARLSRTLRVVVLFCVLPLFSLTALASPGHKHDSGLIPFETKKQSCCGAAENAEFSPLANPEYESYKLTAVYYSVRDSLSTTLMLNNKGPQPLPAVPTLYSMAGARLSLAPIVVPAASYIEVNMADLLAGAADEFREGSMKIAYQGGNMQMGVQVRMIDTENKLIWAEQFVYGSKFLSNRLEGVWWLPFNQSETRLAVSNTSSQTLTATIETDGTAPAQSTLYQVTLAPWETRMLDIMGDVVGNENGHLKEKGGVSITHTGAPGGVLARMYVAKTDRGYSASIPFVDPEATGSQKWHGAGLRLRMNGEDLDSVLVARNNGDQPTTVSGRILYTRPNGSMDEVAIPARSIPANSTRVIDLDNLIDQANVPNAVKFAGIEVNYTTLKGTVTTSVQSMSHNGEHVFQVPMLDPTKLQSSAGGYPWKADGDFRTLLYIKNVTDSVQKYTASMLYPTGGGYSIGQREIKPGETVAVDFKKLRDEQTPDGLGNIIPLDLDHAQLAFSGFGPDAKILSGRAEQMSTAGGIASTYACVNCCGDSPNDAWITPYGEEIGVGGTLGFTAVQEMRNCAYQVTGSFPIFADYWLTADSSVATVDSFGGAEGIAPGDTLITAGWNMGYWIADNGVCVHQNAYSEPTSPVQVPPCAYPVDWQQSGNGTDIGGGVLEFYYTFGSSTGLLEHLSQCLLREFVTYPGYPGAGTYIPPSPPFPNEGFPNPETRGGVPTTGVARDRHSIGSPFVKPYSSQSFTAVQNYEYKCTCISNSWVHLAGPYNIVKSVSPANGSNWKYTVTKSGASATINPLP